jgi:hypothetical protein
VEVVLTLSGATTGQEVTVVVPGVEMVHQALQTRVVAVVVEVQSVQLQRLPAEVVARAS